MNYLAQAPTGVPIGTTFGSPFTAEAGGKNLGDLVSLGLQISFVLAGLLVLFFIVFAGFQIVAGAGQNNPEAAKKGKEAATAAVLGFVIIFVAYWIIRIIEVISGYNFITKPFI